MAPDSLASGTCEADVDEARVELQPGEDRTQVRLVSLPGEGGQPAGGQVHDVFPLPNPQILKRFLSHTSASASCWPPTDQCPSPLLVFAVTGAARLLRPAAAGGLKHLSGATGAGAANRCAAG